MAQVFKFVESGPLKGRKIYRAVVATEEVQGGIQRRAQTIASEAKSILASTEGHDPHNPGNSNAPARVTVERAEGEAKGRRKGRYANIDRFVVLSDERGMGAAMAIEYGISPGIDDQGNFYPGTRAVAPLRRAAGLDIKKRTGVRRGRKFNRRSRRILWSQGFGE